MPQSNSSVKERTDIDIREPNDYVVVLHNDDFTPMDFVVDILIDIFRKSFQEANNIMLHVHNNGKGIAGKYSLDIATSKASKASARAKQEGHPLRLTVEQA